LKVPNDVEAGKPIQISLMVRHPYFNGMQMDQDTHGYTPARYIQAITVREGDKLVFALGGDISLASNPAIGFGFIPKSGDQLTVLVDDSDKTHWKKSFAPPITTN
jgi:sulfur-oxidizing protein SoxY